MANNLPWTPGVGSIITTLERGDLSHTQLVSLDLTPSVGTPSPLSGGQAAMAASLPVAIASNQSKIPITVQDSVGDSCMDDANNALRVNIIAGAGSGGTAMVDDAAFTVGTTNFTPAGGTYRSSRDTVDDNDGGAFAMTQRRALLACLETPNGDSAMDDTNDSVKVTLAGSNSVTIGAAIPAGTNNIGDVDVLTVPADPFGANADAASATGSISAKLRFIAATGIPITGTVTVGSHAVTNAGTFATQPAGSVAHDGAASAVNPVLVGGYASAAAPSAVSADTDSVRAWYLRNGAQATVLTAAGALIGGDATNGLDVDVTQIIPGVGATNLGKAEDAVAASGDVGVMALAVRADTAAATGANGDYVPLLVDANGRQHSNSIISPFTSGGLTTFHLVSAGSTNATNIKASAGQLYGWYIYNSNAAARKVAFHNASGTPTAGASVFFSLVIPPLSGANVFSPIGIAFGTGIAITTVTGLADSDSAAVAANDLIINLWYA